MPSLGGAAEYPEMEPWARIAGQKAGMVRWGGLCLNCGRCGWRYSLHCPQCYNSDWVMSVDQRTLLDAVAADWPGARELLAEAAAEADRLNRPPR